jgi:hypothetical protein
VDFGGQLWPVLLICLVGGTTGISLRRVIGALVKGGKGPAVLKASACSCRRPAGLQNAPT